MRQEGLVKRSSVNIICRLSQSHLSKKVQIAPVLAVAVAGCLLASGRGSAATNEHCKPPAPQPKEQRSGIKFIIHYRRQATTMNIAFLPNLIVSLLVASSLLAPAISVGAAGSAGNVEGVGAVAVVSSSSSSSAADHHDSNINNNKDNQDLLAIVSASGIVPPSDTYSVGSKFNEVSRRRSKNKFYMLMRFSRFSSSSCAQRSH